MDFKTIRYELDAGVLTLTLNRPDRLNAFNNTMMHEMIAALDAADADDSVRAIIVTGEGRGFCAGADLEKGGDTFDYDAQGRSEEESALPPRDGGGLLTLRIYECNKPMIAAVNGPAVGV
ncbi:MAG: enoyl-CoA hydratase-related protein, partial [Pseudomonadales bacterium]